MEIVTGTAPSEPLAGSRLPVLLCHADEDLRTTLRESLEGLGLQVVEASSQEEAQTILGLRQVALVVAHIGTDGVHEQAIWPALEPLRVAARGAPVGLVTGWKIDPTAARDNGYDFVLRKPFELEELLVTIRASLRMP